MSFFAPMLEYCNITTGKLDSNAAITGGEYPFFTCSPETLRINTFAFDTEAVLLAGNNASGVFSVKYWDGKFNAYQRTYVIQSSDESKLSTRFLFFALQMQLARLQNLSTGAATKFLTLGILKKIEIPIPDKVEQLRVVNVLSTYDDLIDTNRRRIALLEESARLLYREWFVKLRFPSHELVEVVDGLPDGWSRVPLSEIATVNSSSISNKDAPETICYIDIASVQTGVISQLNEMPFSEAPGRARRRVQHGDVIWSCVRPNRKSYALIWEPSEEVIASTGFAVLTPSTVSFSYLYLATTTDDFVAFLTNRATGAAYPAVTAKDFQIAEILKPSSTVLADFHANVEPLLALQDCLKKQNNELAEARDALLPKLMSGQLAV